MSVSRLVVAGELAAQLGELVDGNGRRYLDLGEGRRALVTLDPDEAAAALPAVLLVPPAVDFAHYEPVVSWSLKLLTSSTAAGVAAWEELDLLLDLVEAELPVETATPAAYALSPEVPPVPCYSVTLTTQGHMS